jgi:hypothetical protein
MARQHDEIAEGIEIDGVDEATVENRETEEYITNDALVDLLSPGARVRILLTFIRLDGEKLNPAGICERAAINYDTWYRHRDDLIERYGVIEEAGHAGNSPMYRVDMDNPIVKRLDEIRDLAAAHRNRTTDPENE